MKFNKIHDSLIVVFDKDDFRYGIAKKLIAQIKEIPYSERRYDPDTKEWIVFDNPENREMLEPYNQEFYSFDSYEANAFIKKWLSQFKYDATF